jgi:hypothetical protein
LERLTKTESSAAPAAPAATPVPKVDPSKLAALVAVEPAAAPTPPPADAPPQPAVDLSKANEKLSGLLGGKKP